MIKNISESENWIGVEYLAVNIGTRHRVEITGYSHQGDGVGRIDGRAVFVPRTMAGEVVEAEIIGEKKGVIRGKLIAVLSEHPARVKPSCPAYETCGGCSLQHVSYGEQLRIKERMVRDTLRRIGGFDAPPVLPVMGMETPWHYRNKGHFHVAMRGGRLALGFYEEESHRLVPYRCRHLFSENAAGVVECAEKVLNAFPVKVCERDGTGLRTVMVRESRVSGEMLVVFVSNGDFSQEKRNIAREICRECPQVVGVCLDFSSDGKAGGLLPGEKTQTLIGKSRIEDRLGPFSFSISAVSFFQINSSQAERLGEKALEYAALTGRETVVDAYCGIGTLSLFLSQRAKMVIGIEKVGRAVVDATNNAKANRVKNVEFIRGEAENTLPELVAGGLKPDVIVVDPPRRGCGRGLLEAISGAGVPRVVYVSCNPATLARDLRILAAGGYALVEIQPLDMFPQTGHVESIIMMTYSGRKGK